jgi:hypothetical protein
VASPESGAELAAPDEDAVAADELPEDPVDELPDPPSGDPEGEPASPLDVDPQAASAMPTQAAAHGRDSLESIRWVITSLPFRPRSLMVDCGCVTNRGTHADPSRLDDVSTSV